MQYESRMGEMQAGMMHARLHYNTAAVALAIAVASFLALGLYAERQQVSFWWPSIPIPFAAASARRYQQARESRHRMSRLKDFMNGPSNEFRGIGSVSE